MQGSAVDMDRAEKAGGDMQGTVDSLDGDSSVAEACDGGNAPGSGAEGEIGQGACLEPEAAGNVREEAVDTPDGHRAGQARKDAIESTGGTKDGDASVQI